MRLLLLLFLVTLQYSTPAQPLISAHRGSSPNVPENTLATFRAALKLPIRYLEIDVRTTKDGQLVILHDGKLDRTTNGSGPVSNLTLAEVRRLSANKGFDATYREERVPTLAEVGRLVQTWNQTHSRTVNLYVDCKAVDPARLMAELKAFDLLNGAVFYGSDEFLLRLKQMAPQARLMPSLRSAAELPGKIQQLQPYAVDVPWEALTEALIRQIHQHGIRVFSDALDTHESAEDYRKAAQLGVDVIQTDYVQRVAQALVN